MVHIVCSVRKILSHVFVAILVYVSCCNRADVQKFACKFERTLTAKLRTFGAESGRKTQEMRADSFQRLPTLCCALLRFPESFCRRGAHAACRNCAETRSKFRDFNRSSRFSNAEFCGKRASLSSVHAGHRVN